MGAEEGLRHRYDHAAERLLAPARTRVAQVRRQCCRSPIGGQAAVALVGNPQHPGMVLEASACTSVCLPLS